MRDGGADGAEHSRLPAGAGHMKKIIFGIVAALAISLALMFAPAPQAHLHAWCMRAT
jgi:hypothetical protein